MIAVPILLQTITLAHGSDIMWKILDRDFLSTDWRIRFTAVEKTTLLLRFLTEAPVKKSQALRSCLAHAFCHLIASMDDISPQVKPTLSLQSHNLDYQVSQCATVYLGTIHDQAVQTLLWCLDCQFDMVPMDRPPILKSLYKLFTTLDERKILSWEFFANRFESLIMEIKEYGKGSKEEQDNGHPPSQNQAAQQQATVNSVSTERSGERRPKMRVRSGEVRSLAHSLRKDYMRTLSAPAPALAARRGVEDCCRDYRRQQSTPSLNKQGRQSKAETLVPPKAAQGATTGQEEPDYKDVAPKSMQMDQIDKETIHLVTNHTDKTCFFSSVRRSIPHPTRRYPKPSNPTQSHL